MMIEDSREYYAEMKLYNDVMGIALAVWGNVGECPVFHTIDKALDNYNLQELQCIKQSFDLLPEGVQSDIMADLKNENTSAGIERLRETTAALIKSQKARTA
ncbi:MAG: hypothetical protein O6934_05665, partial [SAR324 cluster bacterium]|nr:hypothetical protein [SAR324 cluster bacterium]